MKKFIKDWIIPIAIAAVIALGINKYLFFQVSVPTESMYPTIKPGDRIIVTRIYSTESLKRGDIVVFYNEELKETLIKRLIGLPGEAVEIKENGDLYINNKKIDEPYVKKSDNRPGKYLVPKGSYFFLGDNRPSSWDARLWKQHYIPEENIKGRARLIIFPFDRMGSLK